MDSNFLRDRTLVLRILDERLQARLRDKMANAQDEYHAQQSTPNTNKNKRLPQHLKSPSPSLLNSEGSIFNLDGVTCEPSIQSPSTSTHDSTRWTFNCDGASYPARLTNVPNPIEVHKTHDHAMYYKCVDIAQMLIVYEDMTALQEAEGMPGYKVNEFPSYHQSGLTQPMQNVVKERFSMREHGGIPPSMEEIRDVEGELIDLVNKVSLKEGKGKGRGANAAGGKVWEQVEEEIVSYEPWMDNNGRQPKGIEFDEADDICKLHPEVWLNLADEKNAGTPGHEPRLTEGNLGKAPPPKSPKPPPKEKKKPKRKKKKTQKVPSTSPVQSPVPPPPLPPSAGLDDVDFDLELNIMDDFGDDLGGDLDFNDLVGGG
jgi:transcription initiation factor TFIID subunit 7